MAREKGIVFELLRRVWLSYKSREILFRNIRYLTIKVRDYMRSIPSFQFDTSTAAAAATALRTTNSIYSTGGV